jgi:hypothetical protein
MTDVAASVHAGIGRLFSSVESEAQTDRVGPVA